MEDHSTGKFKYTINLNIVQYAFTSKKYMGPILDKEFIHKGQQMTEG